MAKEFDIFNDSKRPVVCIMESEENYYFPNASLLKEGQVYHVRGVHVGGFNTDVYLEEFPDKRFNSVQFGEITE